jgi:hypothetical protein
MVARDPAICGSCECGFFRCGVQNSNFDNAVASLESRFGTDSCNVTRRKLVLGARDATTGHREKTFPVEDTVKGIFTQNDSVPQKLSVGTFVREDALLQTCAGFKEGDEVKLPNGNYYEVKAVREHYLTPDNFCDRELDLVYLPFHS